MLYVTCLLGALIHKVLTKDIGWKNVHNLENIWWDGVDNWYDLKDTCFYTLNIYQICNFTFLTLNNSDTNYFDLAQTSQLKGLVLQDCLQLQMQIASPSMFISNQ